MIEVRSLDHRHGMRAVLRSVDLVVAPGEVHGLLGPTGAGKTTLLRVLAGIIGPTGGTVSVPGTVAFIDAGEPHGLSGIEAELDPAARHRLALARAVAATPDVLLVDEPAGGLDPEATRTLLLRHAARGGAAVWATRRLDRLHGVASNVTVIVNGRVRYTNTVEALAQRSLAAPSAPLHRAA